MKRVVVLDPGDLKDLIRRRRLTGADRFDEVWNGVYVMSPIADNLHQYLAGKLVSVIYEAIGVEKGVIVLPGANVTDREVDWTKNYRVPDLLVFLPGNTAHDRGSHYFGGPDFAVEVLSKKDRSRKKFKFYAGVGVRELMLIDRDPWCLELFRVRDGEFQPVGKSEPSRSEEIASEVLPLTFRLRSGEPRPQIEATRPDDGRVWLI